MWLVVVVCLGKGEVDSRYTSLVIFVDMDVVSRCCCLGKGEICYLLPLSPNKQQRLTTSISTNITKYVYLLSTSPFPKQQQRLTTSISTNITKDVYLLSTSPFPKQQQRLTTSISTNITKDVYLPSTSPFPKQTTTTNHIHIYKYHQRRMSAIHFSPSPNNNSDGPHQLPPSSPPQQRFTTSIATNTTCN